MTVVGIAQAGFHGLEMMSPADLFVPLMMKTVVTLTWDDMERRNSIWLKVFARLKAGTSAAAAQSAITIPFHSAPVYDLKTLDAQIGETHFLDRLLAWLSLAFGFLATLLASIGLYGITSFSVARRTQEIGIRMALGAARGNVLRLVMREVVILAAAGLSAGIPVALALGKLVESQLFEMNAGDPAVIAGAAAAVLLVSALAGYLPARRATRIDPMQALRWE